MHVILRVFDAIRSFDRPCTCAELARETGLTRDSVRKGLDGLRRRKLLVEDGAPRLRTTYLLAVEAPRPEDLRGRYDRAARMLELPAQCKHSPASPTSHAAQPGALRAGITAIARQSCTLQKLWRKR